jgi:hypothetical protein
LIKVVLSANIFHVFDCTAILAKSYSARMKMPKKAKKMPAEAGMAGTAGLVLLLGERGEDRL